MKLDQKTIEKILQQMKENTKTECIAIRTKISDRRLPVICSKFGGFPYWPKDKLDSYPHSSDGRDLPLTMLAQINLSDLPENGVFPNTGILQFFILNAMDKGNFKVVFHKEIEEPVIFSSSGPIVPTSLMPWEIEITRESGKKEKVQNLFWGDYGFPIAGEFALEFSKKWDYANLTESNFETEFKKAAKQLEIPLPDDFDVYPLPDEYGDEWYDSGCGHKLLGRPYFVQYDFREDDDENEVLLFQIDSLWSDTGAQDENHYIIFGDAGTANFFITKDDLKKLDFSNVYYNWQCC